MHLVVGESQHNNGRTDGMTGAQQQHQFQQQRDSDEVLADRDEGAKEDDEEDDEVDVDGDDAQLDLDEEDEDDIVDDVAAAGGVEEDQEHELLDEVSDEDEEDVLDYGDEAVPMEGQEANGEEVAERQPRQQPQEQQHQMHQGADRRNPAVVSNEVDGQRAQQQNAANEAQQEAPSAQQQQQPEDDPGLDGYDRTDLIGQGAYGVVFRGTQRSSGDIVAIKRIPFGDANMEGGVPCAVIREISLLRELDHPNVVRLLDVIQAQPGGLYLVFEFVAHDLKTYMDSIQTTDDPMQRVGLPKEKVKLFMKQILSGVGFCHTYRVLHRDLKPHNLLITADGNQLKLADFGLARLSALPNGPYTHEVVTLWYRAPELLLGATRYSAAVDVWSVGCIFAEMVTGYALFPGRSDIDQVFKIFQRRGTPTPQTWPAVTRMPHFNPEFPKWPERPITDFIGIEALGSQGAADLLEKILRYDPDLRIGCKAALSHPYFYEQPGGPPQLQPHHHHHQPPISP